MRRGSKGALRSLGRGRSLYVLSYLPRRSFRDCRTKAGCQLSVVRSLRELLSHFLKLLTDYRSVKTIDGDVTPVSFFAFHDEVRKTCGVGCVMTCLRH